MKFRHALLATVCSSLFLTMTANAREYLKSEAGQPRGYSTAVATQGGKTLWISGQVGIRDEQGKSMAGDFEGQVRVIFRAIDAAVKRAGGSMKDVVNITVYLTDPRLLEPLIPIRHEFWPEGNFPASTSITVHSLPFVGMMIEVSAVAVIGDK
ncbi:2-iminobutanoate/2-iminopropanoate deaminase [Variovorax paradoxus]|uniref:RidA family protein n=1 Tax=Variovorax atrisoli TaxID=3394203 RepID=UPI00119A39EB|nr:RidA family protein [Variovorax paradoxus]MDR6523508.1 2-iminobutanoate/2-iminopropanoate deaminase [Variovorax paradoxus]